jgi:hypothetical protein
LLHVPGTNARPVGEQDPDEGDSITVVKTPLAQVPQLICDGRITHSLVIAGFSWYYLGQTSKFR